MSKKNRGKLRFDRGQKLLEEAEAAGGMAIRKLIGRLNGDISPDRRLCLVRQGLETSEDTPDSDNPIFDEEPEDLESMIENMADHADERGG